MRIVLVNPTWRSVTGHREREPAMAPTSLMTIAGLTPEDVEVSIIDEAIEDIKFEAALPDLVGVTVKTPTAGRAYRIAAEYRKRGVPVVLGGIHPTILPDEAAQHADAVAVGEAEETWPQIVRDAQTGHLRKIYQSDRLPRLEGRPLPRRDLVKRGKYLAVNMVQVSRGCPHNCEFCCITRFYGSRCRSRSIDDVLREVDSLDPGGVFFTDDNFGGNPSYAKELMRELAPLGRRWVSETSIPSVEDEGFVDLAARSGCLGFLIGFESLSVDNLRMMRKGQNRPHRYAQIVQRLHERGIGIVASMMFGLDFDDRTVFASVLRFLVENRVEVLQVNVLCPYPGTDLYRRLKTEGRLLDDPWWLNAPPDYYGVHFRPRLMSPEELREGCLWLSNAFYSLPSIVGRAFTIPHKTAERLGLFFLANFGYRKLHPRGAPAEAWSTQGSAGRSRRPGVHAGSRAGLQN